MTSRILSFALYVLLLRRVNCLRPSFATNFKWSSCSVPTVLRLWDISILQCVQECQVRGLCEAVNYRHVGSVCQLMSTVIMAPPGNGERGSCVFIQKVDFSPLALIDDVQTCDKAGVFDVDSGSCTIRECPKLQDDNADVIKGNRNAVGARAWVECKDWYTLNVPLPQVVCQGDGSWTGPPACLPPTACGLPPTLNNAIPVAATLDRTGIHYACKDGCYAPHGENDMTLLCKGDGTWDTVGFTCYKMCPDNWHWIRSSCYYTPSDTKQHWMAKIYCDGEGGYLLQLETRLESDDVNAYLSENYGTARWCLGITDEWHQGVWKWMKTNARASFTDWASGHPVSGATGWIKNFARFRTSMKWEDMNNLQECVPLCEKSTHVPYTDP